MSVIPPPSCRATSSDRESLGLIRDNLIEIADAVQVDDDLEKTLVANGRGKILFNKYKGYGRFFWDPFYRLDEFFDKFFDPISVVHTRTRQLSMAVNNIKRIFNKQLVRMQKVAAAYEQGLKNLCEGANVESVKINDMDLPTLHREINNWNNATYHFLHFVQNQKYREKIMQLFNKYAPSAKGREKE